MTELVDEPNLQALQDYMDKKEQQRGYKHQTTKKKCFLLAEEKGELIQAVRHLDEILMRTVETGTREIEHELADVLTYLLIISNRYHIGLEQYFREYTAARRSINGSNGCASPGAVFPTLPGKPTLQDLQDYLRSYQKKINDHHEYAQDRCMKLARMVCELYDHVSKADPSVVEVSDNQRKVAGQLLAEGLVCILNISNIYNVDLEAGFRSKEVINDQNYQRWYQDQVQQQAGQR